MPYRHSCVILPRYDVLFLPKKTMKLTPKIFLASLLSMATIVAIGAPKISLAASSRDTWLVEQIYAFNHPLATQQPAEVATKIGKMAQSPFAFYRGTAHLFYQDLTTLPASNFENQATLHTFINGDMHLANLGSLRDANGNQVFDTNDFDEGYLGQYHWDLRRMAVSIILAAQENGLSSSVQQQLVNDFSAAYLSQIKQFRGNNNELDFRLTASNTSGVVQDLIKSAAKQKRADFLSKHTSLSNGRRVLQNKSDLQAVSSTSYAQIVQGIGSYVSSIAPSKRYAASYYQVKDVRQKLGSGIGSLGRLRYYVLVEGASSGNDDDVILQVKQQQASVVASLVPGNLPASAYAANDGQRTTRAMKAALSNTDLLAGWTKIAGLDFSVREKSPFEADFDLTLLSSAGKFSNAVQLAGKVLAKNHASADSDYDANLVSWSIDKEIDDILGKNVAAFQADILSFSLNYAQQVKLDYASFIRAKNLGTALY